MELGQKFINRPRCPQSPGWSHEKTSGLHVLGCKSRRCRVCGQYWSYKWQQALKEKVEYDKAMGYPQAKLALTLTFAANVDYKQCHATLRYFWQLARKCYPSVEYWGVVEYNQSHTQPHLHFVLGGVDFVPKEFIRSCWKKAQEWAGIEKVAFITRIEQIDKNVARYFTKYITKLIGGKDEIPRREQWQGRYVRYSAHFFPANIPTMAIYASFKRQFEADCFEWRHHAFTYHNHRACLKGLSGFIEQSDRDNDRLQSILDRTWEPEKDWLKGKPVEIGLFDLAWYNKN